MRSAWSWWVLAWCVLLVLAIGNGGLREAWLVPRLGTENAHLVSTVLLCLLIMLATVLLWPRLAITRRADALRAGALWVALTLAFEFLAGHFVFGKPWPVLLADYDLSAGRVWMLVPVITFLAPALAFWWHGARPTGRNGRGVR
jgi:hypothetical protein